MEHDGNHQSESKLRRTSAKSSSSLGNDDFTLLSSCQVDVISVISRLRDDFEIWKLFEQIACEPCSLTVSYDRIEAAEHRRVSKGTREYLHLRAIAQPTNSRRAFIGSVDIIKNCNPHTLPPLRLG